MYLDDTRDYQIKKFLDYNGDSTFGEISRELERKKLGYANTKGLSKKLNTLVQHNKLKKIPQKPYPVYRVIKNPELSFSIAGDEFGFIPLSNPVNWSLGDDKISPKDSYERNLTKIIVNRFGFYVLASLVESLDYWFFKAKGRKPELIKLWLSRALDLSKYQDEIFTGFLNHLTKDSIFEDTLQENEKIVKKKINELKKSMKELYPNSYRKMIHNYENLWIQDSKLPDKLSEVSGYQKFIK